MDNKFKKNLEILLENNIRICGDGPCWEDKPNSVELETYTNAGGDMIICLEEPSKKCLQDYCNDFDIDGNVIIWWIDGREAAHAKGVPHDNIREHYEDYEAYITKLRRVAELLD